MGFSSSDEAGYCLGADTGQANCNVPGWNFSSGDFLVYEPTEELTSKLLENGELAGQFKFRLIVVGDNDYDSDCGHSGLEFDVTLSLAD